MPLAAAARFGLAAAAALPRPAPLFPAVGFLEADLADVPRLEAALLDLPLLTDAFVDLALLEVAFLEVALVERPLLEDEPPLLEASPPLLAVAVPRRRACASLATRSPEALPLRSFQAAVARLTEAASFAAA